MKNSPTAEFAKASVAPMFVTLDRHERREFLALARQYHHQGFDARQSAELAAENLNPYPQTDYWNRDTKEIPMARHFVPADPSEYWRGGNRSEH